MPQGRHQKKNLNRVSLDEFFRLWDGAEPSVPYLRDKYRDIRDKALKKYSADLRSDPQGFNVLHDVLLIKYADEVVSGRRTGFSRGRQMCSEDLNYVYSNFSKEGVYHDAIVFVNGSNGHETHEIDFVSMVAYRGGEYLHITEFKRTIQGFESAMKQLKAREELGTYWGFMNNEIKGVFFVAAYPYGEYRKNKRPKDVHGFAEVPICFLDESQLKEYKLLSGSEDAPSTGIVFNLPV